MAEEKKKKKAVKDVPAAEENAACETCDAAEEKKADSKKLKKELEALKVKLEETEKKLSDSEKEASDKYARLAAEYDNFRRRSLKEKESIYGDAMADAINGLVPVIDDIVYAEKFGGGNENPEKFAEGVKLILEKLPEKLSKINVSMFGKPGETFDPNLHNAVFHVEDETLGENEIVDVLQCGYKYGDKVIRYAMVKVAN